jgi:O-antigen/teichoic acid export membrane protein
VSRSTSASTLVRNTLANGAGASIGMAIGILITPFTITQLGLSAYGVWTLALTLSFAGGYAAMSDLGIEQATVRYVAEAHSDDDMDALNRTVATTLVFFAIVGLALAALVFVLASSLTSLFDAPDDLRHASTVAFALVGGQLVIEMPSRALTAVLEGTQRFVAYQSIELAKAVLFGALTIAVLVSDHGVIGLAISYVGVSALAFFGYLALAHRAAPGLRLHPRSASLAELRRLLRFGLNVFVFRLTGTAYRQMDKVILGVATQPRLVALYEVANKLHLAATMIQTMSVSALLPAAAAARRDAAVLRDMLLRGGAYTVAAALPFTTAAIVFAGPLLADWIGPEADGATGAAQLFLAYLTLTVFQLVPTTLLVAMGHLRKLILVTVAATFLNLGLSIALVGPLEVEGVLLGTLIATAVGWAPTLLIGLRRFEVPVAVWPRRVLWPQVIPTVLQVAVLFAGLALIGDVGSLPLDGAWMLLSVGVYLLAFSRLGMSGDERRALAGSLRGALSRRRSTVEPGPPGAQPAADPDV